MRISKLILFAFIFIVLEQNQNSLAADLQYNLFDKSKPVGSLRFYKDVADGKEVAAVASPQFVDSFTIVPKGTPNFGFSNAAYWARIEIRDSAYVQKGFVVQIGFSSIQEVDCFFEQDSSLVSLKSGFLRRGEDRAMPFLSPAFSIPGQNGSSRILFLKIKSQTSLVLPVSVSSLLDSYIQDRTIQNTLGLYFGALLIVALYHCALFIFLRDRSYLYFVGFIVTFAFGQMLTGYGYLIGQSSSSFAQMTVPFTHCIQFSAAVFGILFSCLILSTKEFVPKTHSLLRGFCVLSALMIVLSPWIGYRNSERVLVFVNIAPSLILMYSAIVALKKKHRPALYYVQSGLVTLFALVIYNLMYGYDILPFNFFTHFILNFGFALTVLLFSIALADRMNVMQSERNRATDVALQNLKQSIAFKEEKNRLENELIQARKLEMVGTLLSGICHDLRNFLTPLYGYAQIIKKKTNGNEEMAQYVDGLFSAADKTRELTIKLLDFGRKKPWKMVPIQMNWLVDDVILLLKHTIKKNITIVKKSQVSQEIVAGDPSSIQNAIMNLGLNANDAMPHGGILSVEISNALLEKENPILKKFQAEPGQFVSIAVSDTGTGIPPETLPRIFEPFFTTKPTGKGTGLGLGSVYGCIRSHGGCVAVESAVDKGTVFTLYLPVSASKSGPIAPLEMPADLRVHGTVMVVDDEELVRSLITHILEDAGFKVISFANCLEAVAFYKTQWKTIDCVIADKIMADSDGLVCHEKLREINPSVKTVLVSGATENLSQESAMNKGFVAVLEKPFEMKTLIDTISNVVLNS